MKDLTTSQKAQLLGKIKSFLNITWDDHDTDERIWDMAISSMMRLDNICGVELEYVDSCSTSTPNSFYQQLCHLGRDLLPLRVFYLNEKALDDFESNYRSELTSLYMIGKVYVDQQKNVQGD